MKLCCEECPVACDFCKHYNFNGDKNGCYTGDGYCNLHSEQIDPGGYCDDYYCKRVDY